MSKNNVNRKSVREKTAWSYYMQAIEPKDPILNATFPDYHPMWVIQSQKQTVSAINLKVMRENMVFMTRSECAAFLRINISTLRRWESGQKPVPFMAFELLRLLHENIHFKLSHKAWAGWFISHEGRLVSPDRGNLSFSPDELSYVREVANANSSYLAENARLKEETQFLRKELSKYKVVPINIDSQKTNLKENVA